MAETKIAPSFRFEIYMAGDIAQAKQVCREYCFDVGLCVHIEQVDFIYTGGEETGFKVGLLNYPRFRADVDKLAHTADGLADLLMKRLCQHSYMIVGPDETKWVSRRPENH